MKLAGAVGIATDPTTSTAWEKRVASAGGHRYQSTWMGSPRSGQEPPVEVRIDRLLSS